MTPTFSLVVSTRGRRDELLTLLKSLAAQTFENFEIIFVDQNDVLVIEDVLEGPWPFPLRHLKTPQDRGLSRGRNRGLTLASGDYVLFPDDDCWYTPEFLETALSRLQATGADVLTGRAVDEAGRSINGRFEVDAQRVVRDKVWTTQIEWVAFFRRELLERLGGYDEMIGVGAASPWQACEGQDIVLRALSAGAVCWYDPAVNGRHPELDLRRPDPAAARKSRAYGRGMGYVLRKHRFGWLSSLYWIARPLAGAAVAKTRGGGKSAMYYANTALGRLEGVLARRV